MGMRGILRYLGVLFVLFLLFKAMFIFLHVSMKGWEFILFVIVLAGIVDYFATRL